MTPRPKPPKHIQLALTNEGEIKYIKDRRLSMLCLEDAIYAEPDDAIVKELVRIWRKMGRKREPLR